MAHFFGGASRIKKSQRGFNQVIVSDAEKISHTTQKPLIVPRAITPGRDTRTLITKRNTVTGVEGQTN